MGDDRELPLDPVHQGLCRSPVASLGGVDEAPRQLSPVFLYGDGSPVERRALALWSGRNWSRFRGAARATGRRAA
jgi:hypothetical protein